MQTNTIITEMQKKKFQSNVFCNKHLKAKP